MLIIVVSHYHELVLFVNNLAVNCCYGPTLYRTFRFADAVGIPDVPDWTRRPPWWRT